MSRGKASAVRPSPEFPTPRHEYVHSPEKPSLVAVAAAWGIKSKTLEEQSAKGSWPAAREEFWRGVQISVEDKLKARLSDEMAGSILDANKRHLKYGQLLQGCGVASIFSGPDGKPRFKDPKSGQEIEVKNVGELVRFVKEGVEIERKALGLADNIVKVQMARDLARTFMAAVTKYVSDPATLRNIAKDVDGAVRAEEQGLDAELGITIPGTNPSSPRGQGIQ